MIKLGMILLVGLVSGIQDFLFEFGGNLLEFKSEMNSFTYDHE